MKGTRHSLTAALAAGLTLICCCAMLPATAHAANLMPPVQVDFRGDPYGCGKKNLSKGAIREFATKQFEGGMIAVCAALEPGFVRDPHGNDLNHFWQVDAAVLYTAVPGLQYSEFEVYLDVPIYRTIPGLDLAQWYMQDTCSYNPTHVIGGDDFYIEQPQLMYNSFPISRTGDHNVTVHELTTAEKFWRLTTHDISRKLTAVDYVHARLHVRSRSVVKNSSGWMKTFDLEAVAQDV
ncbi:hypothetical protein D2E26_0815 [Bifidobacterium dolichotidis]|uniref:Uncharacterized protein n=1 Tax=Bifidobacterium dolichotidis TaxID=2306976 RepID=A0A430FPK4_9BIFI|nr:hypothetical protein [Bifidobacterium dolichotidis]RSX54761.1 hypothetical protein D2E26_0815 [Bifidobacterium dolichotidis]